MKVLAIGELNVDLILQGYERFPELGKEVLVRDSILTLGSSSAICAVGLARLGDAVSFLGKVGHDTWGDFCRARLAEEGVDISRVIVDERLKTGITTSITGETDPERGLRRLANGRTLVVAKLGAAGAMALDGENLVCVPSLPLRPVDTTGAGDSFDAGFLHRWLAGSGIEEALRYGTACGALSTRALGGTSSQPRAPEVEEFLRQLSPEAHCS